MAYCNIIFNNLLQLIPRHQFQKVVNEYNGDKYVKKLTCWNQLTTLMFAQAKGKDSLRDIETSLRAQSPKLYHFGLPVIKRKDAIKMHTMLNHNGCIPCAVVVSDGKKSDIKAAKEGAYPIKPDSINR